jgi:hypothetical protein
MQAKIISDDEGFIAALHNRAMAANEPHLEIRPPGAVESLWELLIVNPLWALPIGVAGNVIASWIWQAIQDSKQKEMGSWHSGGIKIVLRGDGAAIREFRITGDQEEITRIVERALADVHQQP